MNKRGLFNRETEMAVSICREIIHSRKQRNNCEFIIQKIIDYLAVPSGN